MEILNLYKKPLREVIMWVSRNDSFSLQSVLPFIQGTVSTLRVLHFSNVTMTNVQLKNLLTLIPKLTSLQLVLKEPLTFTKSVVESLGKQKSLRRLLLSKTKFTNQQFKLMMESLDSLHELHLVDMSVTPVITKIIRNFASQHLDRTFRFYVDHALLPANFPDLDPLMDTIHVYGNLQTVYTH
jgi:hypothetical protein